MRQSAISSFRISTTIYIILKDTWYVLLFTDTSVGTGGGGGGGSNSGATTATEWAYPSAAPSYPAPAGSAAGGVATAGGGSGSGSYSPIPAGAFSYPGEALAHHPTTEPVPLPTGMYTRGSYSVYIYIFQPLYIILYTDSLSLVFSVYYTDTMHSFFSRACESLKSLQCFFLWCVYIGVRRCAGRI